MYGPFVRFKSCMPQDVMRVIYLTAATPLHTILFSTSSFLTSLHPYPNELQIPYFFSIHSHQLLSSEIPFCDAMNKSETQNLYTR